MGTIRNLPSCAGLLLRAFWNVAADQSGIPSRQPLTEETDPQSECFLRDDIFSLFSLLELVPLALDILKILEDYPFDFSLVLAGHPVTKRFRHAKVCSVSQYLHSFSAFRQWI